jgi:hypothetical protein
MSYCPPKPGVNLQLFGMAAGFINQLIASGQYKPLSPAQINFLVGKGNWLINAELRQAPLGPVLAEAVGDSNVFAGQGVGDLNDIQAQMDAYPWGHFSIDVGGPNSYGEYVFIGTNDVINMRNAYIAMWGTVNRPEYWAGQPSTMNVMTANPGTIWP